MREVGRIDGPRSTSTSSRSSTTTAKLIGVMTERALARRYVRESRKVSSLVDAPTTIEAIVEVLDAELVVGGEGTVEGRVWVHSIDPERSESQISAGDVVVVGDRDRRAAAVARARRRAARSSATATDPPTRSSTSPASSGAAVAVSPLDSYVSSRMVTLAAPCGAMADAEPLTVGLDDLVSDISEQVKDVHYRAAVAVDETGKPIGLVTRSDLVSPTPRRVILVDHAEAAPERSRRRAGRDRRDPRPPPHRLDRDARAGHRDLRPGRLDRDAGRRALPRQRLRAGRVRRRRCCSARSSPTPCCSTRRRRPSATAPSSSTSSRCSTSTRIAFGREMFEATSDVSDLSAAEIVTPRRQGVRARAAARRSRSPRSRRSATKVLERQDELAEAIKEVRERNGYALAALMVTDILERGTYLLASGDEAAIERAFGVTRRRRRHPPSRT